jgi:hypothetical protein
MSSPSCTCAVPAFLKEGLAYDGRHARMSGRVGTRLVPGFENRVLRLNNLGGPPLASMSTDDKAAVNNPSSFYWQFERFWEVLSVITLALGVIVWLIAPAGGLTTTDGIILLTISIVCVLQAIYFDRKSQQEAAIGR